MKLPRSFTSPAGRRFTLGRVERTKPRFEGDPFWTDVWPIFMGEKQVGRLWRGAIYGRELPWGTTTRELCWAEFPLPPLGLGFDGPPAATVQEAMAVFGRIADEVLDWRADKRVRSVYSKTGFYQKDQP
jgi:hypothetical protein